MTRRGFLFGTAALAAGGAALIEGFRPAKQAQGAPVRRRRTRRPDEVAVISASELLRCRLQNPAGAVLGTVRRALVDAASGEIRWVVVGLAHAKDASAPRYAVLPSSHVRASATGAPALLTDVTERDLQDMAVATPDVPYAPNASEAESTWFLPRYVIEPPRSPPSNSPTAKLVLPLGRVMHAEADAAVGPALGMVREAMIERDTLSVLYLLVDGDPSAPRNAGWLPVPYAALVWEENGKFVAIADPSITADTKRVASLAPPERVRTAWLDDLYGRYGFAFHLASSH
jgi:hypothetical protein